MLTLLSILSGFPSLFVALSSKSIGSYKTTRIHLKKHVTNILFGFTRLSNFQKQMVLPHIAQTENFQHYFRQFFTHLVLEYLFGVIFLMKTVIKYF